MKMSKDFKRAVARALKPKRGASFEERREQVSLEKKIESGTDRIDETLIRALTKPPKRKAARPAAPKFTPEMVRRFNALTGPQALALAHAKPREAPAAPTRLTEEARRREHFNDIANGRECERCHANPCRMDCTAKAPEGSFEPPTMNHTALGFEAGYDAGRAPLLAMLREAVECIHGLRKIAPLSGRTRARITALIARIREALK